MSDLGPMFFFPINLSDLCERQLPHKDGWTRTFTFYYIKIFKKLKKNKILN